MKNEFELEKQLIIISIPTIRKLLSYQKRGSDALLLYLFYYYTAKRQETNQPKATPRFCMKGLKWGQDRFRGADKLLRKLKLIEKISQRDEHGKVTGWYVRVNYIWSSKKEKELELKAPKTTRRKNPPCGKQDTNALSVSNSNALNAIVSKADKESFSFKQKLKAMSEDPKRHIQIISLYWRFKKIVAENKDQYQAFLKRELKPARDLIGFSDKQILEVMEWLENNNTFKWNLNTVLKFIGEDLKRIKPIK